MSGLAPPSNIVYVPNEYFSTIHLGVQSSLCVGTTSVSFTEVLPRVAEVLLRVAEVLPRVAEILPRGTEVLLRVAEVLPRVTEVLPRVTEVPPRVTEVRAAGAPAAAGAPDWYSFDIFAFSAPQKW